MTLEVFAIYNSYDTFFEVICKQLLNFLLCCFRVSLLEANRGIML